MILKEIKEHAELDIAIEKLERDIESYMKEHFSAQVNTMEKMLFKEIVDYLKKEEFEIEQKDSHVIAKYLNKVIEVTKLPHELSGVRISLDKTVQHDVIITIEDKRTHESSRCELVSKKQCFEELKEKFTRLQESKFYFKVYNGEMKSNDFDFYITKKNLSEAILAIFEKSEDDLPF